MTTSRLGNGPPADRPPPLSPTDAALKIRLAIGKAADCLTRALDGLGRDDAARIDWTYVAGQMTASQVFTEDGLDEAVAQAGVKEDAAAPETPIDGKRVTDPFLPPPCTFDGKGGEA